LRAHASYSIFIGGNLVIRRSRNLTITEKRKHPRVKTHNLVSYVCIDDSGNEIDEGMGRAIDISIGGILIETHDPIESHDILLMAIGIKDELIDIKGKVVYCRAEDSEMFRTGIQFLETNEKIRLIVTSLIKTYRKFINQHG
jgi:hypothetical protein